MKKKILYLSAILIICLNNIKVYSQNGCNYLNCIIIIDNELVKPTTIDDQFIFIEDDKTKSIDTIRFEYNMGTIKFTEDAYNKLGRLNAQKEVRFTFSFTNLNMSSKISTYQMKMPVSWLYNSFMIFKVYNYGNKVNKKVFIPQSGYGVEFSNAELTTKLPRRKK